MGWPSLRSAVRAGVGSEVAEPSSREGTLNLFSKGPENKYFSLCGPHTAPVAYSSLFLKQPFKNITTILSSQAAGWVRAVGCSLPIPASMSSLLIFSLFNKFSI